MLPNIHLCPECRMPVEIIGIHAEPEKDRFIITVECVLCKEEALIVLSFNDLNKGGKNA